MSLSIMVACDDAPMSLKISEVIGAEQSLSLRNAVKLDGAQGLMRDGESIVVWIALDSNPISGLSLLASLKEAFPKSAYVISKGEPDTELMRTAYRLGAADFLDARSWNSDLSTLTERIATKRATIITDHATTGPLGVMLVCDANTGKRAALHDLIMSQKTLTLLDTVSTLSASERAQETHPQVIWIELNPSPAIGLTLLSQLRREHPHTPIFVSYDLADYDFIRESFRRGATDFFDERHWRMDVAAAVKAIAPSPQQPLRWSVAAIWIIILAAFGFWCTHQ